MPQRQTEKGSAILVPFVSRVREGEDAVQNMHNPQNPAVTVAGERAKGDTIRVVPRFGVGYVFDLGQTDGEPQPEPPAVQAITAAPLSDAALWDALLDWLRDEGVAIAVEDCGGLNGYYSRLIGTDQATKTLAHETAHHIVEHYGGRERGVRHAIPLRTRHERLYLPLCGRLG